MPERVGERGELLRKLVHIGVGGLALSLRFLSWPQAAAMAVVLLAVVLAIFVGFTRIMGIEKIFQGQR